MAQVLLQLFTVVVASSYLTLGVFSPDRAGELWWQYAIVTFVLAVANLIVLRRQHHHT